MSKRKKLILIDSNALVHRAFHALPPFTTKDGTPSGAVYGVALTLLSVMEKFKPDYIAATFDLKGKTFRHKKFKDYKAKRIKAPDELYVQIPLAKELMEAFGIPVYEKEGYEADDVIGTVAKNKKLNGDIERIIVTGDMDTLQLVDENVKVFTLRRGIKDTFLYDEQQVRNRYSLDPNQIVDYKSLRGDPSDNIPGVAGIGEKTATELLKQYKTLDGVYQKLEEIKSLATRKKLEEGKVSAYLSQELAEIKTDVPVDFDLEKCLTEDYDKEKLIKFFEKMGFSSLVKRMGGDKGDLEDRGNRGKNKRIETKIISGKRKVENLIGEIKKAGQFSFWFLAKDKRGSLRRSGRSMRNNSSGAEVKGMGVYVDGNEAYFVGVNEMKSLEGVFKDSKIKKVGFNLKLAIQLLALPKTLPSPPFAREGKDYDDVQIMAYLLGHNAGDLDKLIFKEFGAELSQDNNKNGQGNLLAGTDESKSKDAGERAGWVMRLFETYKDKIGKKRARGLNKIYQELELPLIPILARMEMAGVKVDRKKLGEVSALAEKKIKELEKEIYKLAGEEFNINSPSQVAPILYQRLKISTAGIKRGKTGFSTDADQLRKIKDLHPIVPLIEEYREFFKIKSTYADALPELIEDDGRIHAKFNQAVTATGRLSSSDPNLQNIPKRGRLADTIREAFVAERGKVLVSADYSQIDLRVAAHLSGDSKMIESFNQGKDIHTATAAWVNKIAEDKVDAKTRNEAKSLNFGILYGMGLYGFMRDSGVSMERAKFFLDHYKKTFVGLTKFIEKTKEEARKQGYVETEMGRRRYIPNIKASNVMLRNAAERVAINLPVQGLAADIMKLAMIRVEEMVLNKNPLSPPLKKGEEDAELILQIHDELIFEVDEKIADKFAEEVKRVMEGVYELKVPLVVDVAKGKNWREL